jgi:uncharacterized protein YcfJ
MRLPIEGSSPLEVFMKKVAIAVASLFTALAPAAFAQTYWSAPDPYYQSREPVRTDDRFRDREGRRDFARVIESRPIESAASRQECFNPRAGVYEEVRGDNRTRVGKGAAIGAVTGGVLGHQVDHGGGTAAGAVLGGILGHQLERRNERTTQDDLDFNRCRVIADSGAAPRYEVRYEYEGREYVTTLDHDPGRRLRLGEDIGHDGRPYG